MKISNYNLDELDLDFVLGVFQELEKCFGENAKNILLSSNFIDRIVEDSEYVHHYDESYWADVIKNKYYARNNKVNL